MDVCVIWQDYDYLLAIVSSEDAARDYIERYNEANPRYARSELSCQVVALDDLPPIERDESATETQEEHEAKEAAEYAAHPEWYASTGSYLNIPGSLMV